MLYLTINKTNMKNEGDGTAFLSVVNRSDYKKRKMECSAIEWRNTYVCPL